MKIKVLASGSTGNATVISDGITSLLLDAGISIDKLQQLTNYNISKIDGCLITHEHKDHSEAIEDLQMYGISVFASLGTQTKCNIKTKTIKALNEFEIGTFKVLPFDLEHDAEEPLGFLLHSKVTDEKVLYATDTKFIRYKFKGLTHIIIECNYDDETLREKTSDPKYAMERGGRVYRSHMGLNTLLKFLQATDRSRLRQIHLIHMSKTSCDQNKAKRAVQALTGVEVYKY